MHFSILFILACAAEQEAAPKTLPCSLTEQTEISFAPTTMLCVQVDMEQEDFTALGAQYRFGDEPKDQFSGVLGHIASSCNRPFPDPFDYFPADIQVEGLQAIDIGVRKKGFIGSLLEGSAERPSLKVKADKFIANQTIGEIANITLNNNLSDATRMRTCLTYSIFADAGYPAPRCNLANVMVNGQSLGAYTHVEPIKNDFLLRVFGNDSGSLYEATIADFTTDHFAKGLGRWEVKTDATDRSTDLLLAIAHALQQDNETLEDALSQVMDVDLLLQFWALETLTGHWDGFTAGTNNTYIYFDPENAGRGVLIPWGPDDALRDNDEDSAEEDEPSFVSSELTRRISRHPALQQRYLATLEQLLTEVWNEDALLTRIDNFSTQVATAETTFEEHQDAVDELSSWIMGQREAIEEYIAQGGDLGNKAPLSCGEDMSDFSELGDLVSLYSHSCASSPSGGFHWFTLALLLLMRRRLSPRQFAKPH